MHFRQFDHLLIKYPRRYKCIDEINTKEMSKICQNDIFDNCTRTKYYPFISSGTNEFWIGLMPYRSIDGRTFTTDMWDRQGDCVAIVKYLGENKPAARNCSKKRPFICMAPTVQIDYIGKY